MTPAIIAKRRSPERLNPAMVRNPRMERIHKINSTPAISRNGLGSIPITHPTAIRIRISQRVMACPLIKNKFMSGMEKPPIWI